MNTSFQNVPAVVVNDDGLWTETMFRGLAENLVVGMYLLEDGQFRYVNQRCAQILGYSREELLGKRLLDVVPDTERELVHEKIHQTLHGESRKVHYERKARRQDGTVFNVEIFGSRFDVDDRALIAAVMVDVTDRKQAELEAQFSSMVYHHSSRAMVVTDSGGAILTVNPAFTYITGYQLDEVIGRRLNILSSGLHDTAFYERMWASLNSTGTWEGDVWNKRKNGDLYAERLSITTTYNDDGSPRCRIGLFSDITEHRREQENIWRQARHDQLTGLPNRYLFHEHLDAKVNHAKSVDGGLALLYMDLDFFKDVNDTLGHAAGDELLRLVAGRLLACLRESDLVARMGGDEFCVIADGLVSAEAASGLCQKIAQRLSDPYDLDSGQASVSASIGVAFYPRDATDIDDLLQHADLAMYAAKDKGTGQHAFYNPALGDERQSRTEFSQALAQALPSGQLTPFFQPVCHLSSTGVAWVEALVCWQHPERGLLGPMQFVPQAEDTGLIAHIGEWLFNEATRKLAQWRDAGADDLRMAISISPAQVLNERMQPQHWVQHLQSLGLPTDSIIVQVSEDLLLNANDQAFEKLALLRQAGIKIGLDNFAAGPSSLSSLQRLTIEYIKVNRSLVRSLDGDPGQLQLFEAIVLMAHHLGVKVAAEGVRSDNLLRRIHEAGCDFGQGSYFARAVSATDFETFLGLTQA